MSDMLADRSLPERIEALLGEDLREVEEIYRQELASTRPCVTDILEHAARFRGKRLRPMLLLLSASASGEVSADHRILAAVVEMIHTATLVHDDVLDEADTRRHVATVNSRWNNETSVLFGDYLFTHAFHLASSLDTTFACRTIGRATNLVCEGELSQIHERGNFDLDEETYLRIIDGKTAELCAVSCLLGAHYAGAEPAVVDALESYGRSLGVAFQIADDLLDIFGTEEVVGKSLGSDFEKKKLTLPLIRLLQTANDEDAAKYREWLSQANSASWQKLAQRLKASDAVDYARRRAQEFSVSARCQLTILRDSPARRVLEEIAEFAIQRSF